MNDAFSDDDVATTGTPIVLAECIDNAVANVIVIGCGVRNLTRKACDRPQQIGTRYNADQIFAPHHRAAA